MRKKKRIDSDKLLKNVGWKKKQLLSVIDGYVINKILKHVVDASSVKGN